MSAVALDGVSISLGGRRVVRDVSAKVGTGDWVAVIGPNGAGKTTLLRAIGGLVRHDGVIAVLGVPHAAASRRDLARRVALVPQVPSTPPEFLVRDYVLLGRTPHISYLGAESRRDLDAAERALDRLDLIGLGARRLGTLSGGERQRAVLARALAQDAPVLLLDEPTSALDVGRGQEVLELLDELRRERGLTVVSAMHDLTLAGQFATRLVLLADGAVAADGRPRDVLTEEALERYYGADVRVVDDGVQRAVVPVRRRASPS